MDFYEESSAWLSSSDDEGANPGSGIIAVTPYSRISAYMHPSPHAKKVLLTRVHAPHNPSRELAVLKLLRDRQLNESSGAGQHVIPLLGYDVSHSGRITLEFPLMETDLKQIYMEKKETIAKSAGLTTLMVQRFLDILGALHWIHALGIIHRDVNPANILLSNDLTQPAYLADFGISWIEEYPDDPDEGIDKFSSGVGTG
jgi:serine/threonine protein kinase